MQDCTFGVDMLEPEEILRAVEYREVIMGSILAFTRISVYREEFHKMILLK
jgi:hypothetical protein